MKIENLRIVFFIIYIMISEKVHCTSLIESNGTAAKDIDGKLLLNLGRQLNKPMITLLGMAIRNLENLHPCDDWTQWSDCGTINKGFISTRKRTRLCGKNQYSPVKNETKTTATDISICEGFCPKDYNMTANGFCVKLYVSRKTFDDAEKQCREDGGHVINIDSTMKNKDVKAVTQGFSNAIFIDGQRKDSSSPWLAMNGSEKKFFNWNSGEPDSSLCIYLHYANSYWYDSTCTTTRPFVCEIEQ
ncbi:uncharacterized protein LOC128549112 [Mercenaria mercenaria]|uniref:uncharacterized protein LOC128549112 n=1 Tax=Mercenaria mercenaria TaxID=6596 RepID=UPI00234F9658|nr:uncharacterized protein LOC128549112 [Mercenaria mercenaria]